MESNEIPPGSNPPPLTPPPVIVPPAQPRPRRSRGWMIFAIVLLVLLGFSLLLNLGQWVGNLASGGGSRSQMAGPRLHEAILEDNGSANKIAVIDLDGIITGAATQRGGYSMPEMLQAQLDRASDDSKVRAVILRVDSPGGEVLASDEMYRDLVDFQKKSGKPVITSMGSLAASGGYYVSSASRWIVANQLTLTASIGVIMHTWNYRGLMDKIGLRPVVYKSGKFKDMLSGERSPSQIPPEEHAMVQKLIEQTFHRFEDVVAAGRARAHRENKDQGKALASDWKDYADGRVLSGKQAYDLGFVDELGDFDTAVARAKEIAGIRHANLVEYRQEYSLADFLSMLGKSKTPVIKVDLGLDPPKIEAGRLYFLSSTFLQ